MPRERPVKYPRGGRLKTLNTNEYDDSELYEWVRIARDEDNFAETTRRLYKEERARIERRRRAAKEEG